MRPVFFSSSSYCPITHSLSFLYSLGYFERIIRCTGDFISQSAIFRNKSNKEAWIIQSQSTSPPRFSSYFPMIYARTIFSADLSISLSSKGRTKSFQRSMEKASNNLRAISFVSIYLLVPFFWSASIFSFQTIAFFLISSASSFSLSNK